MNIKKYNNYISNLFSLLPFSSGFDFEEKDVNVFTQSMYMLDRTQSIFEYSGLPDTIPARVLELYLQVNGHCIFTKYNDTFYIFTGGLGGEPDVYYMPTLYAVANPALNLSKQYKIGEDGIVINNDAMYIGLMPLFNKYASLIAETELSMQIAIINSRIIDLIAAGDDSTKESAERFLADVKAGKLGIIATNLFLDDASLQTLPYTSAGHSNNITQLIEMEQYAKAAWLNDLGLNANYNMKREALSTAESQLNDDALRPLIDNMLECRRVALEKINEMYGLDITVELASSWKDNQVEIEAELKQLENAADPEETPEETLEEEAEEDPEETLEEEAEETPEETPEEEAEEEPEETPEEEPEETEETGLGKKDRRSD